jgi:hypothetical protein
MEILVFAFEILTILTTIVAFGCVVVLLLRGVVYLINEVKTETLLIMLFLSSVLMWVLFELVQLYS